MGVLQCIVAHTATVSIRMYAYNGLPSKRYFSQNYNSPSPQLFVATITTGEPLNFDTPEMKENSFNLDLVIGPAHTDKCTKLPKKLGHLP